MGHFSLRHTIWVALSFAGSAILLFSCQERSAEPDLGADEALMTEYSEHLTIINSQNGRRSYRFSTPLLEGYMQAREPYREFRKGIEMITYQDDSLTSVDVVLTANYAIYYEKRKLWEAKGNVVVRKFDGKTLYTQQLFWNATTKKVYSNVDSKVVRGDGRTAVVGTGFESDDEFKEWRFRYIKGRTEVDVAPKEQSDSTAFRDADGVEPGSGVRSSSGQEAAGAASGSRRGGKGVRVERIDMSQKSRKSPRPGAPGSAGAASRPAPALAHPSEQRPAAQISSEAERRKSADEPLRRSADLDLQPQRNINGQDNL